MANFRVGQRVRIVGADVSKFLIGKETTITELFAEARSVTGGTYVGHRTAEINYCGKDFIAKPGQLEPIQDDGRKVVSWAECLWQPNHESAPA